MKKLFVFAAIMAGISINGNCSDFDDNYDVSLDNDEYIDYNANNDSDKKLREFGSKKLDYADDDTFTLLNDKEDDDFYLNDNKDDFLKNQNSYDFNKDSNTDSFSIFDEDNLSIDDEKDNEVGYSSRSNGIYDRSLQNKYDDNKYKDSSTYNDGVYSSGSNGIYDY
ncbi:MAG: hypothetical protein IJ848_02455 [Alphaproteobacteria bacterium]|nr:hypothetical protein [Alphaproteobacteria bacterium]